MNNNFVNQETSVTNIIQEFFNEEFGKVRSMYYNEKPYIVGTDIGKCLKYKNPSNVLRRHVSENNKIDGSLIHIPVLDSIGRKQYPVFINEAGLYELITRSKMPKAKKLCQWILSNVFPKLRRDNIHHNTVVSDQNPQEALQKQEEENDRLRDIIDEQQERINRMKSREKIYVITLLVLIVLIVLLLR